MLRRKNRLCTGTHEFVARDQIAPGLIRRVCRSCQAVSLLIIPEEASKPRWAPPWEMTTPPRGDPWTVAA